MVVVPNMAFKQGLWCLNLHWDGVCGAQSSTGAVFLVPKVAMRLCLLCLNWLGGVCGS